MTVSLGVWDENGDVYVSLLLYECFNLLGCERSLDKFRLYTLIYHYGYFTLI